MSSDGKQLKAPAGIAEHAASCCRAAAEFVRAGRYESAREALSELWEGVGHRPSVEGLGGAEAAELLFRCGVVTGWLGNVHNLPGAQEQAKDLLSEALRLFQEQGLDLKAADVQGELGLCYWRLGAYGEARVMLDEASRGVGEGDADLKVKVLIRRTIVELWDGRHRDALETINEAAPFVEECDDASKGAWHGHKGLVLRRLATDEGRGDYADRAIIEMTAAIYHFGRAGHERFCGTNLNNLAMLLYKLGRYAEAHEHLDRARAVFTRLRDPGHLAQMDETRARVLVAEQKYHEANRIIDGVIRTFEQVGSSALLADAMTIQGVVWARLGNHESSVNILRRAVRAGQESGAHANAGLAALSLIEEHGASRLSDSELCRTYRRADELLRDTQDAEHIARLRACAELVVRRLSGVRLDQDFSLHGAVKELEARFIEQALEEAEGSVTSAARLLGLKHQSLNYLLATKHKKLQAKRTPARKRLRGGVKSPRPPAREDE